MELVSEAELFVLTLIPSAAFLKSPSSTYGTGRHSKRWIMDYTRETGSTVKKRKRGMEPPSGQPHRQDRQFGELMSAAVRPSIQDVMYVSRER